MNKTAVKNFAVWARNKLIEEITYKAGLLGVTENGIVPELPASTETLKLYDIGTKKPVKVEGNAVIQRNSLVNAINDKAAKIGYKEAFQYVIDEVAYTWFNRLIAVRFMEVNDYLPSGVRVLSSEKAGKSEPDMVTAPFDTDIPFSEDDKAVMKNLKDDELFRFLFIKQCNKLGEILPELFEMTESYADLLLTLSFTDNDSVVCHLVNDIPEKYFDIEEEGQIQIIGWLYQYYNTEPKAKVFADLKKNVKISKENIPAATQLFTPDWIVRYMVENSLGRLWAEGHEDFDKSEWKYYIEEAEQEETVKAKLDEIRAEYGNISPEEIKFCDPCMGSGHILVYAFDVFMGIYLSQGYSERDAASKIIRNNLYGLDIDKRAYQLAYFALMMKARQYDRRFLTRGIEPNLSHFQWLDSVRDSVVSGTLKEFARQFEECDAYGSLMEIKAGDGLDEALDNLYKTFNGFEGFVGISRKQTEQMMRIYTALSQKYDVICTNPPYMGGSNMNAVLANFVKKNFPDGKSDLFSCFIERGLNLVKPKGFNCMVTMQSWMFLSSFEKMREKILCTKTITNLMHMENMVMGIAFGTAVSILRNTYIKGYKGTYNQIKLEDIGNGKPIEFPVMKNRFSQVSQDNFSKIPGAPVAYWVSKNFINAFENEKLKTISRARRGLETGNNEKYLKLWYEVPIQKIDFNCCTLKNFNKKWLPHNKGGNFRNWYGNFEYIVNFENDGFEIRQSGNLNGYDVYLKEGITWTALTSSKNSFRYTPKGHTFDSNKGPLIIDNGKNIINYLLGFFNSNVAYYICKILNPTLSLQNGDMDKLPIIQNSERKPKIDQLVQENITLSKTDWDSFETSWDFQKHPLIRKTSLISEAYSEWEKECEDRFNTLKSNEEELNRIFIDIYGLQDELTPEVEDKDVTVRKADLKREIKSFVSYAVGCMFGRYSIYMDGLIFAGEKYSLRKWVDKMNEKPGTISQEEVMRAYRNEGVIISEMFFPYKFPVVPITDEEYFFDDIVKRFAEFVEFVYGEKTLEKNLKFIADVLGTKGNTPRQKIRSYFLGDFIKDHIKTYQKRPIYWLFDSGKQNGFKALVYMHRWDANTTGNVRVEYLHKLQRIYEREITRMQEIIDSDADSREKALAEKRKDKLSKQLKETRDYDEKLTHLALARIDIDLDDGVKANYEKVQTARDGRKLEILTPIK